MKKFYCAKKLPISLLLTFLAAVTLNAESFRVSKVHELAVVQTADSEGTAKLGIKSIFFNYELQITNYLFTNILITNHSLTKAFVYASITSFVFLVLSSRKKVNR